MGQECTPSSRQLLATNREPGTLSERGGGQVVHVPCRGRVPNIRAQEEAEALMPAERLLVPRSVAGGSGLEPVLRLLRGS